jgi:tetratricopeptide (TPR) repeat protein
VRSIILIIFFILLALAVSAQEANSAELTSDQPQKQMLNGVEYQTLNESLKVDRDVKNATLLNNWANHQLKNGYFNISVMNYEVAIKDDPSFIDPWNNKGVALVYLSRYEDAIKCFDQAISLDNNNEIVWSNKGTALFRMSRTKEAFDCFNKSIELNSRNAPAWNIKGLFMAEGGMYLDALDCFNRSIETDIYHFSAWNNKGVTLARLGRYNDAVGCFFNAVTLDQNDTVAWLNGGLAQMALGNKEKAGLAFAKARTLGFNGTANDYQMQPEEPALLEESKKKSGGFEGALAAAGLFALACAMIRRRGKSGCSGAPR